MSHPDPPDPPDRGSPQAGPEPPPGSIACPDAPKFYWDAGSTADEERYSGKRAQLVATQLRRRDIRDVHVLRAMGKVPRHRFVDPSNRHYAYADRPLPLGCRQTISQPYIVALMTQLGGAAPGMRALDIGTGSGYQAAVLAEIVDHVYGVEIICELATAARDRLAALGYTNVTLKCGDGYRGWPEHAPFDLIIVAAAPEAIPQPLIDQLAPSGKLVIPVGRNNQYLTLVERSPDGQIHRREGIPVRFVPMTGAAERGR